MAYGLPVEGDRGPYVGSAVVDVATCRPDERASDVAARVKDRAVVVACDGMAVGEVDAGRLASADGHETVLDLMEVVARAIRPSVPLADIDERIAGRLVTTPDGRILGIVDPSVVAP